MYREQIEAYFDARRQELVDQTFRLVRIDSTKGAAQPGMPFGPGPAAALEEAMQMAREIDVLRKAGADGFVIGCLTPEGDLDGTAMAPLLSAAEGAGLTLHRCIDVSRDLTATYLAAGELGIDTVLTSGGAPNATAGMETIGKLLSLEGPQVLIGAGVNAKVIAHFRSRFPAAAAFHMSGKTEIESGMRFRREGIPMGIPGFDEWHIQQTGEEAVRKAREALAK